MQIQQIYLPTYFRKTVVYFYARNLKPMFRTPGVMIFSSHYISSVVESNGNESQRRHGDTREGSLIERLIRDSMNANDAMTLK